MKGVVFTEFLEMVEMQYGLETLDRIICRAKLPHGGAYTAVGTYEHEELLTLIEGVVDEKSIDAKELVMQFSDHLFRTFVSKYPFVLENVRNSIEFLNRVDGFIHVEVRKLYSDATPPRITVRQLEPDVHELVYRSAKPFGDLCEGLILACARFFKDEICIDRKDANTASMFISYFKIQTHL